MRITTNMIAFNAAHNLSIADKRTGSSLERLSSGYKVNSSKDNPVGAALSAKMRSQLRNLSKAVQSTSDGISVIETAESVLAETQSMVQRIRELCVQAASDTNTDDDRGSIMSEINQLRKEIDRVSNDTDFNTKKLLNGDLGRVAYTNKPDVDISYVSTDVAAGVYWLQVDNLATQAQYTGTVTGGESGSLSINGVNVNILASDSIDMIHKKIQDAADKSGITVTNNNGTFEYVSNRYGSKYGIEISCDNAELRTSLGLNSDRIAEFGTDIDMYVITKNMTGDSIFPDSSVTECDGNTITVTANDGFEMRVDVGEKMNLAQGGLVTINVTNFGAMTVQVGPNEGQEVIIDTPRVDCSMMGLDNILAYTSRGADSAITTCDEAISYISEVRSRIGAYQNRMEHTQSSLDATVEAMTSSLSRIVDTDMAEEMTIYTTQNVISQAATAMLAQANQLGDKVLQLLQ